VLWNLGLFGHQRQVLVRNPVPCLNGLAGEAHNLSDLSMAVIGEYLVKILHELPLPEIKMARKCFFRLQIVFAYLRLVSSTRESDMSDELSKLKYEAQTMATVIDAVTRPRKQALQPRAFQSTEEAEYIERCLDAASEAAGDMYVNAHGAMEEATSPVMKAEMKEGLDLLRKARQRLSYVHGLARDRVERDNEAANNDIGNAPSRGEARRGHNQGGV
jgi:hypothetical protein